MFALVLTKLTMKLFWLLKKNYIIVFSKKHPLMFLRSLTVGGMCSCRFQGA